MQRSMADSTDTTNPPITREAIEAQISLLTDIADHSTATLTYGFILVDLAQWQSGCRFGWRIDPRYSPAKILVNPTGARPLGTSSNAQ
jgi:hypothetical protein